jgi:2-keto-4-pentenoate hydratase/2-oxohepta-3-ene-1,7-dioic acid hydratase in catechol pathway
MKIVRFNNNKIGVVKGDRVVDVTMLFGKDAAAEWPPVAINRLIASFDAYKGEIERLLKAGEGEPLSAVRLLTPVPWPNKLMAYPVNYMKHATEMKSVGYANVQGYFLKANSSLSGASEPIVLPPLPDREIHHECELALIIGKTGRGIAREQAMDYIFGFSCLMDITVRGKEERVFRKSYDTFTPVGPWIVTRDEVTDPNNLRLRLSVNDELRQDANTHDLIVDIPDMIAVASSASTLYPGDIIATGTPEGVGPIRDGDRVTIEIEQVGRMTVDVRQGTQGANGVFLRPAVPA